MDLCKNRMKRKESCWHTVLLHDTQELEDDFRAWSDHDLALASLFGVVDALEAIIEDAVVISKDRTHWQQICLRSLDHFDGRR